MTATDVTSDSFNIAPASAGMPADGERNAVFSSLVTADTDVVGLVAYAIYKQNKHDWLVAFRSQRGRDPDDNDHAAYIVGESTARRLATYRHLAEATIEGRGPEVTFSRGSEVQRRPMRPSSPVRRGLPPLAWAGIGLLAIVLFLLAARFGLPGITPRP